MSSISGYEAEWVMENIGPEFNICWVCRPDGLRRGWAYMHFDRGLRWVDEGMASPLAVVDGTWVMLYVLVR